MNNSFLALGLLLLGLKGIASSEYNSLIYSPDQLEKSPLATSTPLQGQPKEKQKMSSKTEEVREDIIHSSHDKSKYRHLTLPNGLQALLVSDATLDKSSAALNVNIGNFYDPEDLPGLAHFLEHLLFLGTSKYPGENEYSQFLSKHGGHSNAYTANENTNYFFEVASPHFRNALDRFAQFFIAPTFNPSGTQRELLAVDSENKKNLRNDGWRAQQLQKHLSNPKHPFHHFGTGNKETLGSIPESKGTITRDRLISFYNEHYSATIMKLVVYGKEDLDHLQRMVVEMFSPIPKREVILQPWLKEPGTGDPTGVKPLLPEHLGKFIKMKTIKDQRALRISWQLHDLTDQLSIKPGHFVASLLGHEGEGSLLSYLKTKGWATSLETWSDSNSKGFSFFQISLELSKTGKDAIPEILQTIFQYLGMLRREGPKKWFFDELKALEEVHFRFREKGNGMTFCERTANQMHHYPPQSILKGPFVVAEWNYDAIMNVIKALCSSRQMRIFYQTQDPFSLSRRALFSADKIENPEIQIEPWYETEYAVEDISPLFLDRLDDWAHLQAGNKAFHYPKPNPFIPDDAEALQSKLGAALIPRIEPKLIDPPTCKDVSIPFLKDCNARYRLWHKQDDIFESPKVCLSLQILSKTLHNSARNSLLTKVFLLLLKDHLTETLYEASLAGLTLRISSSINGLVLHFCGYDQKFNPFVKRVLGEILAFKAEEQRFHLIRDRVKRDLENRIHNMPYIIATRYAQGSMSREYWWFWERMEHIPSMTKEEIDLFMKESVIAPDSSVEALCHGNMREDEAMAIFDDVKRILSPLFTSAAPFPRQELADSRIIKLKDGDDLIFSPKPLPNLNSAIDMHLQIGSTGDLRIRCLTRVFGQIFKEPFFDALRTKEQLGYVVHHDMTQSGTSIGLRFLIQSESDPSFLDDRIERFLQEDNLIPLLEGMSESNFKRHISSVAEKLTSKKRSMIEETSSYWSQIYNGQLDFERDWVDAMYLESGKIGRSDIISFIRERVLATSPKRRKLSVHLWSENKAERRNEFYGSIGDKRKNFEDPKQLVRSVPDSYDNIYDLNILGRDVAGLATIPPLTN